MPDMQNAPTGNGGVLLTAKPAGKG